jgi:WD40 repeat protein
VRRARSDSDYKFDAFLSYSQSDAAEAAAAIEEGLERLARPWNRRRALNVYRDRSSQTATADLSGSLRRALMQSRRLVVLASPGAAASPWVGEEVGHWRSARSSEDVLIALVGGEMRWSPAESDFDWTATTCLPAALAGAFSSEPKYVDLRPLVDAGRWNLHDPGFRDAVAELSGSLTGRDKDDLVGEDLRQFKKGRRVRRIAVALLVVLTVVSLVAGMVAVVQRRRAEARASQILAERLADTGVVLAPTRPLDGIVAALASLNVRETPAGHRALLHALSTAGTVPEAIGSHTEFLDLIEFSPDGDVLLSAAAAQLQLRDPKTRELLADQEVIDETRSDDVDFPCAVSDATFLRRGDQVVTLDECGRLVAWSVPDLEPVRVANAPADSIALARAPDAEMVALLARASIAIHRAEDLTMTRQLTSPLPAGEGLTTLAVLSDGVVIVGGADGSLAMLHLGGARVKPLESPHATRIERLRASGQTPGLFISIDASETATVWRLDNDSGSVVAVPLDLGEHGFGVADGGFGGGGSTLWTVSTAGDIAEWDINDDGLQLISDGALPSVDGFFVGEVGVAVHPRDRVIVAADVSGVLYRWRLGERPTLVRPIETDSDAEHIDLFADGRSIVVAGRGEVWLGKLAGNRTEGAVVWRAPPGAEIRDVVLSPDGRHLAVATLTGVHGLGRANDGSWDDHWTWTAPDVLGVQFVGNDRFAAATESGLFVLLNALSGEPQLEAPLVEDPTWGPLDNLVAFSFGPSGRVAMVLGSCGSYACSQIVDVGGGMRREIDATAPAVILGDLELAAYVDDYTHVGDQTVSESRIRIIGTSADDTRDSTIRVPLRAMDLIGSTDGRIMLVVTTSDTRVDESLVRLHDTATTEQLGQDLRLESDVGDADLSPDGDLVGVVTDGDAAIYDSDAFHLDLVIRRACDVLGRNAHGFEWDELTGGRPYRHICPGAPSNFFDLTEAE